MGSSMGVVDIPYFTKIYHRIGDILDSETINKNSADRRFAEMLLDIGEKLNINTEFYEQMFNKALVNAINNESEEDK